MTGYFIALLNAVTTSLQNSAIKKTKGVDVYLMNAVRLFPAIVVLAIWLSVIGKWDLPPLSYWFIILCISLPAEFVMMHFLAEGYRTSPQSLVGPLLSLTLVFIVPLAYFVLGEVPNAKGLAGVALILISALALGWQKENVGIRAALAKLWQEKGAVYILIASFCGALTSTFAKLSYQYASPILTAFYITLLVVLINTIIAWRMRALSTAEGRVRDMLVPSAFFSVSSLLHYIGLSLVPAAYYIAVKRTSILLDVLLGRAFFKEKEGLKRTVIALTMLAGAALVVFSR